MEYPHLPDKLTDQPSDSRKSIAKHKQAIKEEKRRKTRVTRKEKSVPGALDESSTTLSEHDPGRDMEKLVNDFHLNLNLNWDLVATSVGLK